jgi:excisionase family DNA binding protein
VGLSAEDLLNAIGCTVRLDVVLRSRYAALTTSPRPAAQSEPESPRYLDTDEAARYLNVSRSTVVRLTQAGNLRCTRPSAGVVRYDRQDLDSFMNARKS